MIDEDLGQSGSSAQWRDGFQRLAHDVAHGRIGAILALEVSRLSRSSADWHRLLELCGLADVLIIDEQACYTPRDYNDRLLLGLKGTMSEAEQYWMKLRLQGGKLSKARRGELFMPPPPGYQWDETSGRFRLDPDEEVQRAVRLIFERFRLDGSAGAVQRYFIRHGLAMPARDSATGQMRPMPTTKQNPISPILRSPIYAGAYVYGRTEQGAALVNGKLERRHTRRLSHEAWKICLRNHHPAYIEWDEYMTNQRRLAANRSNHKLMDQRGAAREGHALLQGLAMCGKCGRRMTVRYQGRNQQAQYQCSDLDPKTGKPRMCFNVSATTVDEAVAKLFLEAVKPAEIELGIAVLAEVERQAAQVDRQWQLRLERVRYEAHLAERRYKAVDPDNRVIARTREREWNDKLEEVERAERDRDEALRRDKLKLDQNDREKNSRHYHLPASLRTRCSVEEAPALSFRDCGRHYQATHPQRNVPLRPLASPGTEGRLERGYRHDPAQSSYGGAYVLEQLWRELGIDAVLAERAATQRIRQPFERALFAMVANRALAPYSKLYCWEQWLRDEVFLPDGAALELHHLYGAMDFLEEHKLEIEREVYFRMADLMNADVDLIFYDTTSLHFETDEEDEQEVTDRRTGRKYEPQRRRGHSKNGRGDAPQIVVGLAITRDGLPVRSWVFAGQTTDVTTVEQIKEDLRGWRLGRCIFVGDAGMNSEDNRRTLGLGGGKSILGAKMRAGDEVTTDVLARAGRYHQVDDTLRVKEVFVGEGERRRRYVIAHNPAEEERQRAHREKLVGKLEEELATLEHRGDGKLSKRAMGLLVSKRYGRYLCQDPGGKLRIDRAAVTRDAHYDGKWVITSNDDTLTVTDLALGYKQLLRVERCWRQLKSGLRMRPVFHFRPWRIQAHVSISVLALLLERIVEIRSGDSWRNVAAKLASIKVVEYDRGEVRVQQTTELRAEVAALLKLLRVEPPPRLHRIMALADATPPDPAA